MEERKKVLVLTKFQRWFLINFVLYTALFLGILATGLFLWFQVVAKQLIDLAGLLSPTFLLTVDKYSQLGIGVILLLLIALLGLAAYQSLLFSHRIAGPIYALARHLEKCEEEGVMKPLQLRKGDLFADVADKFNRLSEKVNKE